MSAVDSSSMAVAPAVPGSGLPASLVDVTPRWITAALRSQGLDVEVVDVACTPIAQGKGMLSDLGVCHLTYASSGTAIGPASLVVKLPAEHEANRAVAVGFHCYERETSYFRHVAGRVSAWLPAVYYSELDGPERFAILMEDLSDYRVGDQVEGCDSADAALAVRCAAGLHAPFWHDVDRPELEAFPYHSPSYFSEGLQQGAAAGWDNMLMRFGADLPGYIRESKDRYLAALPRMQQWITSEPLTLVHGDLRLDNVFFGVRPEHRPFVTCDFQGSVRGKAIHDVAYLLTQSVRTEERRAHERDLIALWQAALVEHGVPDYSFDQAWHDYQRAALYMWTYAVVNSGALDPVNDRGRAWMQQMVTRTAAVIDDLGLFELLSEFEGPAPSA